MTTPTTPPPPVLDKLGRPITADRCIAGARAAGLRLERGYWISRPLGCCCADGGLCLSDIPSADGSECHFWMDSTITKPMRVGLSDGFEGLTMIEWLRGDMAKDPAYFACHAIGREVYARRHEAGGGTGEGQDGSSPDDSSPCPDGQHRWIRRRMGGPPDAAESLEVVEYCDLCGAENMEAD